MESRVLAQEGGVQMFLPLTWMTQLGKYERNVKKVQLTTNQCNHNLQGPVTTSAHLQTDAG